MDLPKDPRVLLLFFLIILMILARQATKKSQTEKYEVYDGVRIPIRR